MTNYEPTDLELGHIITLKMVINGMTEEQFEDSGYSFTYKSIKLLVDRITQLESELELQKILWDDADASNR